MIFAALLEAAERGELILAPGGMCRFHRRRDGVVVIREIIVLPERRREGIGRILIQEIRSRHPGADLVARCPEEYEANKFWEAMGFECDDPGAINGWWLHS